MKEEGNSGWKAIAAEKRERVISGERARESEGGEGDESRLPLPPPPHVLVQDL